MFILLSYHTVSSSIWNLHLSVFQAAKIALTEVAHAISAFLNSLMEISARLNSKPYDYLY